ncbi:hypothetical protein [Bartonella sp. MU37NMGALS]
MFKIVDNKAGEVSLRGMRILKPKSWGNPQDTLSSLTETGASGKYDSGL